MLKYYRRHLINYQLLILLLGLSITWIFIIFGMSRNYLGEGDYLYALAYSNELNSRMMRINNFLSNIIIGILVILTCRKCDLPIIVYHGRVKCSLARLCFTIIISIIISLWTFCIMIICAKSFLSFYIITKQFFVSYIKSLINNLILLMILQIIVKVENKILVPIIVGCFLFIKPLIIDFQQYLTIYRYLIPVDGSYIYNNYLGYIYLLMYVGLLFLVYLLIRKYEPLHK